MMFVPAKTRFRLCQADRDAYGDPPGTDGWVTFDPDALAELPCSELEAIESASGFRIAAFWIASQRVSARGQRAALWIARRMAGLVDDFTTFDPRILLAESEIVPAESTGDDADPPGQTSADGSTAAP
jgi:hypothetical protein